MNLSRVVLAALLFAPVAEAQVGVPPARSPFRDVENRMGLTFLAGFFNGAKDPVGVSPQDGPYLGARYDVRFGSLISLTGRGAVVTTKRDIIDPGLPEGQRVIGELEHNLFLVDGGVTLSLTGAKSYRRLLPELTLGVGATSDLQGADVGDYQFRTKFLFTAGAGVGWVAGPRWLVRGDLTNYMYKIHYPAAYFLPSSDGTSVRSVDNSVYTHNLALSIGLSYRFFR